MDHLFSGGDLAAAVWIFFSNCCGINNRQGRIRDRLIKWWLSSTNNRVHTVLIHCLPLFICWEIWKARCNHKYEDIKSSPDAIINKVIYQIRMFVACQFPQVQLKQQWCKTLLHIENFKPRINIKCLRWSRPISGRFKLNTDGCSKGNPGSAVGGGVLQDENGQMIMAYSEYYGECSNNVAEPKVILCGITWFMTNGFKDVDIESDSMLVVKMINEHTKVHFHIMPIIHQINKLKRQGSYKFQHCYRETNGRLLGKLGRQAKTKLFLYTEFDLA